MKILFASSEAFPLVKTGGLGDVGNTLPNALSAKGAEVRLVLPAYPVVLDGVQGLRELTRFDLPLAGTVRILEGRNASFRFPLLLVDNPALFDRPGNPYVDAAGAPWSDNAERFCTFSRAVELLGMGACGIPWRADIVHCNDWQTGLVPALLARHGNRPGTVFTIHNVSYDCLLERPTFDRLALPGEWWSIDSGEFFGRFSLQKCGIVYGDAVTTVSPGYAREICTPEFGYGYAGILDAHRGKLSGILNGIDVDVWNPSRDTHLVRNYGPTDDIPAAKRANLEALLEDIDAGTGFRHNKACCLGFVGRLVYQKGIDVLLDSIPEILSRVSARFVVLGTGEPGFEERLRNLAAEYPDDVAVYVGYSERNAHLLEAGCDLFLMPSRFEPCGLNQMYSMVYGTPPVVHRTGGLSDTVIDADEVSMANGSATGFVFDEVSVHTMVPAIRRAMEIHADPARRARLIANCMSRDFGWERSASSYLRLYRERLSASDPVRGTDSTIHGTTDG